MQKRVSRGGDTDWITDYRRHRLARLEVGLDCFGYYPGYCKVVKHPRFDCTNIQIIKDGFYLRRSLSVDHFHLNSVHSLDSLQFVGDKDECPGRQWCSEQLEQ